MLRRCKFLFSLWLLLLAAGVAPSQTLTPAGLNKFLDKAELATNKYATTFKNLSAEELKTNKYFRDNETLVEMRLVKSLFIVYQSPRGSISEFRNVTEFNGRQVTQDDEKIANFFTELAAADSDNDEAGKIIREGTRHDGHMISWGITLNQENLFGDFRPFSSLRLSAPKNWKGTTRSLSGTGRSHQPC